MTHLSHSPRLARLAALPLSAVLAAGLWMPAQAAPDPNPTTNTGTLNRARRADRDVLRGTIERVYSARSFDLRDRDGRVYRVDLPFSVGLQSGLNVRVSGDLNGSNFSARVVSISQDDPRDAGNDNDPYGLNNDYPGNSQNDNTGQTGAGIRAELVGRVTRLLSRTSFDVRSDGGQVYRVQTDRALDASVREGDTIIVRGNYDGRVLRATSASEIGAGNGADQGQLGQLVDFPGTITSLDSGRGEARVRADNGSIYIVSAGRAALDGLRVGNRVRVAGHYRFGRVEADALTRIY